MIVRFAHSFIQDEFEYEIRKRKYPTWNLRHVEIWKVETNLRRKTVLEYQARFVKLLEGCVPSLASGSAL